MFRVQDVPQEEGFSGCFRQLCILQHATTVTYRDIQGEREIERVRDESLCVVSNIEVREVTQQREHLWYQISPEKNVRIRSTRRDHATDGERGSSNKMDGYPKY